MFSEKEPPSRLVDAFPASLPEPPSYYHGISDPARPRADNLIAFLRTSRASLQQKHLANRSHHRHVLLLVIETAGSAIVNGTEHRLEVGQAFYVKPFQFHHYLNLEREALQWLFLTFDLESGAEAMSTVSDLPLCPRATDVSLWREIVRHACGRDTNARAEALPLLDHLLHRLARAGSPTSPAKARSSWIAKAESLILQSVEQGWTVDVIAEKLGMSSRHLRSLFEAEMGINIRKYRANYQLHRAISLMRDPQLPLGRIAEFSGFNSQAVFNRFIKRETGSAPTALRKALTSPRSPGRSGSWAARTPAPRR